MNIQDHSILLAPGSLHLALYEEIFRQKGNCLDINVMTPEAYIQSQLRCPREQTLPTLYAYQQRLADLPQDNVFYDSRGDYEFLSACYDFIGWMQLLQIRELPEETAKDRDIKAVLDRLSSIPLWQQEAGTLTFPQADRVYILNAQYPEQTAWVLERLIQAGAHVLEQPPHEQKQEYWAASNPRKEMELVADEIIQKGYAAEDVFIALGSSVDTRVLDQVFNHRGIPHTFLHDPVPSGILKQFQTICTYILDPSEDHLQDVLKELFFRQSADLRTYLRLFPAGSSLKELVYQDNPLISLQEFERLQSLEAQSEPWMPDLNRIKHWDHTSIEDIAQLIQDQNPKPTEDDIKMFDSIMSAWISIQNQVHSKEDLTLFVKHLNSLHPSATLHTMRGALVGAPKEITGLRPIVFFVGADAAHYPGLIMHGGIFDEDYLAKTAFPPLQQRLTTQKTQLEARLKQPETLYVLTPQSNYEGDPIDSSFEMNTWLGRLPQFVRVDDPSIWSAPDFSLTQEASTHLFAPNQTFQAGARSLQTFQDCPLKHMLRFGLRVRNHDRILDHLTLRPDVLHQLLFQAKMTMGKTYDQLTKEDVEQLVAEQLAFPAQVFAGNQSVLAILQRETTEKVWELLQALHAVNEDWKLTMTAEDYNVQLQETIGDLNVEITGSLTPANRAPFSLYDPAERAANPMAGPKASLALGLNLKPVEASAYKISYGRAASSTASMDPIIGQQNEQAFISEFIKSSVTAQNLDDVQSGYADLLKKKVPTYEQKQTDLKQAAEGFVLSLSSGCIAPEHKSGACKYCPYASICRNGAVEKG